MGLCPGCGTFGAKTKTAPGRPRWLVILVGIHPYHPPPCFCTQGTLWLMTGEHLAEGSCVDEGPGSGCSIFLCPSGCLSSHPGFWPHPLPSFLLWTSHCSKGGVGLSQQHLNSFFSSVVCKEMLHKNLFLRRNLCFNKLLSDRSEPLPCFVGISERDASSVVWG